MISVKGTKTGAAALPGEEFAEREPARRSRVPYLVGAVLSAVVLYVKSAMPGSATPIEPTQDRAPDGTAHKERLAETQNQLAAGEANDQRNPVTTERRLQGHDQEAIAPTDFFGSAGIHFVPAGAMPRPQAANVDGLPMMPVQEVDVLQGLDLHSHVSSLEDPGAQSSGGGVSAARGPSKRNPPTLVARQPYLLDVTSGAITAIALTDLLATVSQANGAELFVVDASVTSGTLIQTAEGFLYRSDPEFLGEVELSYKVSDGASVLTQVALLTVDPTVAEGTSGNERITGTAYAEDVRGLDGDDDIDAGGGTDIVHGGAGHDVIAGGAGNDRLFGEDGHDTIMGGAGNDWVSGDAGHDKLYGQDGNDTLLGGAGDDVLSDGTGADVVDGGEGSDLVLAAADSQSDRLDGGAGIDTLDYSNAAEAMVIDLLAGVAEGVGIGQDEVLNFEIIIAGSGDDHIIAGRGELTLTGGDGNDRFEFVGTEPSNDVIRTIHQILDFDVGDRIIAKGIELFERVDDGTAELSELRENDPGNSGHGAQIRLTYEQFEDYDQTVIEWDSDSADDLTTVLLHGHHVLVWSSTT